MVRIDSPISGSLSAQRAYPGHASESVIPWDNQHLRTIVLEKTLMAIGQGVSTGALQQRH